MLPKPVCLIIFDGFGLNPAPNHNAIYEANTPNWNNLIKTYPLAKLECSGKLVGLPEGQMGNSEVGHMHISAGRVINQDLQRINLAIENREFFNNKIFLNTIEKIKQLNKRLHVFGLLSSGGVHAHVKHIQAICKLAEQSNCDYALHAFLDGRDTPPKSALQSIETINQQIINGKYGKFVSITGRYYAMDRDKRYERTQAAYEMLTEGKATRYAKTAEQALTTAYDQGETDEFVKTSAICNSADDFTTIKDGDAIIFMNFRADRARQLSYAFTSDKFDGFNRNIKPDLSNFVSLTQYSEDLPAKVAFTPQKINNTLGEWLAKKNLSQLRLAETEKYAHVTFFFNGGSEKTFSNETRKLIPSPKVATYDLCPQMSAKEVTDAFIQATDENIDIIICNFANADMVGHSGNFAATKQAIESLDQCLGRIITKLKSIDGECFITSDHGNAEQMYDPLSNQPHTAHTNNMVPFLYMGRNAKLIHEFGSLIDIAPSILSILGLEPPKEMTGKALFVVE